MQGSATIVGSLSKSGPRRDRGRTAMLVLAAAGIGLAGCAAPRQDIQNNTVAERKPLEKAMVDMPPGGPAIVGVVERNYANSTTQEVVLSNRSHVPGQNVMSVTLFGPVKLVTGTDNLHPNDPLATMNAAREIREALPGVPMQVSNLYAQNKYGAFGYATGRTGSGDTCLYAWQRIRAPDLDSTLISDQGTIAIRLRLCEPRATETALLGVMTDFNINAYFLASRWNPYGAAPPLPEDLGKPGQSVLPPQDAFGTVPAAPVRPRRTVAAVTETVVPVVPIAVETIPAPTVTVPAPTVSATPVPTTDALTPDGYAAVPPP